MFLLAHRDKNLIRTDAALMMTPMVVAVPKSVPTTLQPPAAEVSLLMTAADINAKAATPAPDIMIAAELGSIVPEPLVMLIQHVAVFHVKAIIFRTNAITKATVKAFIATAIVPGTVPPLVLKAVLATALLKQEKAGLIRLAPPVQE